MLKPGEGSSVHYARIIDDKYKHDSYSPACSTLNLERLAALTSSRQDPGPSTSNGKRRLSSAGTESEEDIKPLRTKKARTDGQLNAASPVKRTSRWRRILTHSLALLPYYESDAQEHDTPSAEELPKILDVNIEYNAIMYREQHIAGLALPHSHALFKENAKKIPNTAYHWLSAAEELERKANLARISVRLVRVDDYHGNSSRATIGREKKALAPFHFRLEVSVELDFGTIGKEDSTWQLQVMAVLHHAFVECNMHGSYVSAVQDRAGISYRESNLEWFYACLLRPPLNAGQRSQMQPDKKGKGKAREMDIESYERIIITPADLKPTLLPFQSRSLAWMLYREGKTVIGEDDAGKHTIGDLPDEEVLRNSRRGSFWQQIEFEDGERVWFNTLTMDTSDEDSAEAEPPFREGSIAAEEMGLGKTVEMLALILLNTDKERRKLPAYLLEKSGSMVQPSGQTLLVCPQAIVKQWQDEIERHAPTLRVLRYEGMRTTYPKEVNMKRFLKDYDIILCTFDVLTAEVGIARKPVIHTTRGNSHKPEHERINYRRSLLVGVDWLRVIIDEAQMAASTTSAISETASLIPRKYSWGVSGTPIKQTIADLAGLLKFLRIQWVDDSSVLFTRLLHPSFANVFSRLVSKIGIRTTKAQIPNELTLPPQSRFIVPAEFSAVEKFSYRNRYNDALLDLDLAVEGRALLQDWSLEPQKLSRWLHLLRQACFHAQAGAPLIRPAGANKANAANNVVLTLDEVLLSLRDRNIAELHADQRNAANARVQRAYRAMYDKEDCEKFESALKLLRSAKRDLHLVAEDIHNEMLLIMPEVGKASPSDSRSSSTAPGHAYLNAFRDTVKDLTESLKDKDDEKAKERGRHIGMLSTRLREVVIAMHTAVFFTGNAYFGMGNKEEDETAAYAEAEVLRKQVLRGDEAQALRIVKKMSDRIKLKPIRSSDVEVEFTDEEPGIQSGRAFESIEEVTEQANKIGKLMMEWRKFIIDGLSSPLTDQDISADEYQNKAEVQEKLDIYIEYLGRIYADWVQILTGQRSALADAPSVGGSNPIADAPPVASTSEGRVSKRSLYKKKAGMSSAQATAIIAAADPAARLRIELEQQRKDVIHEKIQDSLRGQLRELNVLKERVLREEEIGIIQREARRLRIILADKEKIIEQLQAEQNLFVNAYNARVNFFSLMQEFSDSVAELQPHEASPGALKQSMAELKGKESELERSMLAKVARRRFLDSLKSKNEEDEVCLICSDVEKGQVVLTHCGHLYHEQCLRIWSSKAHTTTCPVCRASLRRDNAWQRVHLKAPEPELEKANGDDDMDIDEDVNEEGSKRKGKGKAKVLDKEQALEDIEGDADPSQQLNYLPPDEVEDIKAIPLQNAALGSKLDMITRHVIHLRDRHARMIRDADQPMTNGHSSAPFPPSSTSKQADGSRDRESTPPNGPFNNDLAEDSQPTEAKILIYSGWQYACEVLASAFAREKIGYVRLETSAGNSAKQKEKAVVEFKENPDVTVFILHAQSQAAGLNLISAQYVILVEPLLQTALEVQAIARVHRIGQRQRTTVYQYVIPTTVDERIALLSLHRKGHTLFSRSQDVDSLNAPSVPLASPGKAGKGSRGTSGKGKKKTIEVGQDGASSGALEDDKVDVDDLAKLLLEKQEFDQLQKILLERAALAAARRRQANGNQ